MLENTENTINSEGVGKRVPSRSNAKDFLSAVKVAKEQAKDDVWQQQQDTRMNDVVSLSSHGASATDPKMKECYDVACRLEIAAGMASAFDGSTGNYEDVIKNFATKYDPGDKSIYNAFYDFVQRGSITEDELEARTIGKIEEPQNSYNPMLSSDEGESSYDPFEGQDYSQYDIKSTGKKMPTAKKYLLRGIGLEGAGLVGEKLGKSIQSSAVNRSQLDRTQNILYNSKKRELGQWESHVKLLESELEDGIKNGESEEWISKKKAELYDAEKEVERLSKTKKPIDSREILSKYGITGSEEEIAGKARGQHKYLWKSQVQPLIKGTEETINLEKFFEELNPSEFSKELRTQKEFQKIIDDYLLNYIGKTEVTLEEAREIYNGLPDLSDDAIKGNIPLQAEKRISDRFKTYIQNSTKESLKKANPDKVDYIDELFNDISKLKAQEESAVKGVSLRAKPMKFKDLFSKRGRTKILDKTGDRTKAGKTIKNVSHKIRPTTWIKGLLNFISKNGDGINKILNKIKGNVGDVIGGKGKPMGGDMMDILVSEMLYEAGEEPLDYAIAEIAAYAYETYKLNKENGTDLPLYDKENSYVNQNPNKDKNGLLPKGVTRAANNIEEQDWYKAIKEKEEQSGKEYDDRISEIDIEELLNSVE